MKQDEVPQEPLLFGPFREICYATDEEGRYVLEPCAGWDPSNFANQQAWQVIKDEVEAAAKTVREGQKSPLAFWMALHQMDAGLLASYAGVGRLTIWWHLKPAGFARLGEAMRQKYADLFRISVEDLAKVPDQILIPGLIDEPKGG